MLYSKETNGTSKLSPTTDLSKLEQRINNLQNAVTALQNKVDPHFSYYVYRTTRARMVTHKYVHENWK